MTDSDPDPDSDSDSEVEKTDFNEYETLNPFCKRPRIVTLGAIHRQNVYFNSGTP